LNTLLDKGLQQLKGDLVMWRALKEQIHDLEDEILREADKIRKKRNKK
jgi:hypothetical protein